MRVTHLLGLRPSSWVRLLAETRFGVAPVNLPSALSVTASSLVNGALARSDDRIDVSRARVEAPVFVLGHWRAGTTHLQYLLNQDPALVSPNTYEVCFPASLLCSERTHGRLLARLLPTTRLQDAMAFGMHVPNEDEIALAALGLPSPYLYWAFPEQEARWMRYLSFADAEPGQRERFCRGLDLYLRKLAHKHGRTLVLKSPPHTARIALLLSMYPDARFVHISRHPLDVFRSTRHLWDTYHREVAFIGRPDPAGTDRRILAIHEMLYDAFFEDVSSIPAGRYHHMRYEDLVEDPVGQLAALYEALGLGPLPVSRMRAYLASISGYRTNAHPVLGPRLASRVRRAWSRSFDAFGYA